MSNHRLAVINSERLNDVFPDPLLTPPNGAGVAVGVEEKEKSVAVGVVVGAEEKEKRLVDDVVVSVEEEEPMETDKLLLDVVLVVRIDDIATEDEDEDERTVSELTLTADVTGEVVVGKGTVSAEEGKRVGTAEVDAPQPTVTVDRTVTVWTTPVGSTFEAVVVPIGVAVTVVCESVQVIVGTTVGRVD